MNWYYAEGNQQVGPVDDAALESLAASGRITATTLVWHAGMPNWAPYSSVRASAAKTIAMPVAMPVSAGPEAAAPQRAPIAAETRYCVECGTPHPASEMVQFGDSFVCANCKQMYAQKLREGVLTAGNVRYAGFWIRLVAQLIDGLILGTVSMLLVVVAGASSFAASATGSTTFSIMSVIVSLVIYLLIFAIAISYETYFIHRSGATPGKMACGLRVITASGAPITWGIAIGRVLSKIISQIILYIGYIMAAFDPEKRALHDRIVDTRVIHVR